MSDKIVPVTIEDELETFKAAAERLGMTHSEAIAVAGALSKRFGDRLMDMTGEESAQAIAEELAKVRGG